MNSNKRKVKEKNAKYDLDKGEPKGDLMVNSRS